MERRADRQTDGTGGQAGRCAHAQRNAKLRPDARTRMCGRARAHTHTAHTSGTHVRTPSYDARARLAGPAHPLPPGHVCTPVLTLPTDLDELRGRRGLRATRSYLRRPAQSSAAPSSGAPSCRRPPVRAPPSYPYPPPLPPLPSLLPFLLSPPAPTPRGGMGRQAM